MKDFFTFKKQDRGNFVLSVYLYTKSWNYNQSSVIVRNFNKILFDSGYAYILLDDMPKSIVFV